MPSSPAKTRPAHAAPTAAPVGPSSPNIALLVADHAKCQDRCTSIPARAAELRVKIDGLARAIPDAISQGDAQAAAEMRAARADAETELRDLVAAERIAMGRMHEADRALAVAQLPTARTAVATESAEFSRLANALHRRALDLANTRREARSIFLRSGVQNDLQPDGALVLDGVAAVVLGSLCRITAEGAST